MDEEAREMALLRSVPYRMSTNFVFAILHWRSVPRWILNAQQQIFATENNRRRLLRSMSALLVVRLSLS